MGWSGHGAHHGRTGARIVILYLTYNDQPSGVYWSQVTDVVAHLNTLGGPPVRLLALVSGRGFLVTRRSIRQRCPGALVLPMVPGMRRWRRNALLVKAAFLFLRPTGVVCRGPFATTLALSARKQGLVERVVYDGRGAYAAEWEEYRIIDDPVFIATVRPVEREALLQSDHRIAVSHALVDHWRERYGYSDDAHVVIPCTLANTWPMVDRDIGTHKEGLTRLVYSGSSADWQSFRMLQEMLDGWLTRRQDLRVLFLSRKDAHIEGLALRHPGRVEVQWLDHERVPAAMASCDYGIMVRERTITNQVASPTKFAEYLSCGLRVIISEGLGDLTATVLQSDLGAVVGTSDLPELPPLTPVQRDRARQYAHDHFTKSAYRSAYLRLLDVLRGAI
jgi:hypothetical protein